MLWIFKRFNQAADIFVLEGLADINFATKELEGFGVICESVLDDLLTMSGVSSASMFNLPWLLSNHPSRRLQLASLLRMYPYPICWSAMSMSKDKRLTPPKTDISHRPLRRSQSCQHFYHIASLYSPLTERCIAHHGSLVFYGARVISRHHAEVVSLSLTFLHWSVWSALDTTLRQQKLTKDPLLLFRSSIQTSGSLSPIEDPSPCKPRKSLQCRLLTLFSCITTSLPVGPAGPLPICNVCLLHGIFRIRCCGLTGIKIAPKRQYVLRDQVYSCGTDSISDGVQLVNWWIGYSEFDWIGVVIAE